MATAADYDRLGAWAVMLEPGTDIDRRTRHRTVPLEVLSLGMPRTGTLSMQEALSTLGYATPYHYVSIFANARDADMWLPAFRAKAAGKPFTRREWDQLLGHCGAVTDVPCVYFWRELVAAYPEAKIVLVERDEDKWFASIEGLLEGVLNPVAVYVLRFTDPRWFGRINNTGLQWIEAFFGSTNLAQAKRNARQAYRAHYAGIRATVPKERLLEYELGSGWEPLCEFLGKDVPGVAFPRRNEAKTIQAAFGMVLTKAFRHSLINIAVVVGIGAVVGGAAWRLAV
ncbi:hypothetical protein LTR36_009761 [Oleoguttula mirabilis]|uniref:Sulfotransferase n=1 Tax=Oleoguttula mirabilis TaxID=1507867 RepID=A0AAV9J5P8_9PEZI|nr:hypothetical protein LTR36_009761 [Oleoguttula mirabilis]